MKDEVTKVPPRDFSYPFSNERDPIDVFWNENVVPLRKLHKSLPATLAKP